MHASPILPHTMPTQTVASPGTPCIGESGTVGGPAVEWLPLPLAGLRVLPAGRSMSPERLARLNGRATPAEQSLNGLCSSSQRGQSCAINEPLQPRSPHLATRERSPYQALAAHRARDGQCSEAGSKQRAVHVLLGRTTRTPYIGAVHRTALGHQQHTNRATDRIVQPTQQQQHKHTQSLDRSHHIIVQHLYQRRTSPHTRTSLANRSRPRYHLATSFP